MACVDVEAPVPAMIRWVTEENTRCRSRAQFVRHGCCLIGIAKAAEHTQLVVIWWCAKKKLVWGFGASALARPSVDEQRGSGQSLDPKLTGHAGVEKETSFRVLIIRSALRFCDEVYGQVRRSTTPWR